MAERSEFLRQTERRPCVLCGEPMTAVSTLVRITYYKCLNEDCSAKSLVPFPRMKKEQREEIFNQQSGGRVNAPSVTGPLDEEKEMEGPLNPPSRAKKTSKKAPPLNGNRD